MKKMTLALSILLIIQQSYSAKRTPKASDLKTVEQSLNAHGKTLEEITAFAATAGVNTQNITSRNPYHLKTSGQEFKDKMLKQTAEATKDLTPQEKMKAVLKMKRAFSGRQKKF